MLEFEEWSHRLRNNCGHYYGEMGRPHAPFSGHFRMHDNGCVEVAEIGCEIDRIERTLAGIRRDEFEHIFLLLQRSGATKVTHNGREELLEPGQCLLLDSTLPAELRYDGATASFLSAHLPRGLCLEGRKTPLVTGRKIDANHPLGASFRTLLSPETCEAAHQYSPDFVSDLVGLAFGGDSAGMDATRIHCRRDRYGLVMSVLDGNLTDPDLTLDRLATRVRMSRRQLQREFTDHGTSFTACLTGKRLNFVAEALRTAARRQQQPAISELAYAAGFGEITHFNRAFRQCFGKSPRAYLNDTGTTATIH